GIEVEAAPRCSRGRRGNLQGTGSGIARGRTGLSRSCGGVISASQRCRRQNARAAAAGKSERRSKNDTSACEHHRPPLFCIPPWEGRESQNVPWTVLPRHSSVNSTVATVDGSLQGYPRRIPHGGERHHPSDSNRLVAGVIRIASPAPPAGGSASHHVE